MIEGKRARWALKLSEYDYEIQHIAGKQNILADALSRRPDYMEGKIENPETELFTYQDGKIVQNPEAIYAKRLQIQEKEILEEIKTATEELSEEAKEVFEKEGLMMNENGVYRMREKIFVSYHPKQKER
jgi:glutamate-1-semialdehyde aminotransferase